MPDRQELNTEAEPERLFPSEEYPQPGDVPLLSITQAELDLVETFDNQQPYHAGFGD